MSTVYISDLEVGNKPGKPSDHIWMNQFLELVMLSSSYHPLTLQRDRPKHTFRQKHIHINDIVILTLVNFNLISHTLSKLAMT